MKNKNLIAVALTVLGTFTVFAQDIDPNTVPANLRQSLVLLDSSVSTLSIA